jgi:hypothetical protein
MSCKTGSGVLGAFSYFLVKMNICIIKYKWKEAFWANTYLHCSLFFLFPYILSYPLLKMLAATSIYFTTQK